MTLLGDTWREIPGVIEKEGTPLPDAVLDSIGSLDITIRNYAADRNAIIAIALLTFAYRMAGKVQRPEYGSNDILLLKALAENESLKRKGQGGSDNELWNSPLYELITGDVGERIRKTKFMTNPR